MAAVRALSDPQAVADVDAAVEWLAEQPGVDGARIGLLGVCVGGSIAVLAASRPSRLRCAVAFYGLLEYAELTDNKPRSPLDAVTELAIPLLGHWGDADHLVPVDHVRELRRRVRGRPAEIYLYPGAGHAFHEDFRDVYRPIAAAEAWERSLRHLDWHLRSLPA
jgi:carboxymethylenebutenolidase